jgi:hypothetical protein
MRSPCGGLALAGLMMMTISVITRDTGRFALSRSCECRHRCKTTHTRLTCSQEIFRISCLHLTVWGLPAPPPGPFAQRRLVHVCDKGDVRYIASLQGHIDPGGEVTVEREPRLRISATMSDYGYPYVRHLVTVLTRMNRIRTEA